MRFPEQLGNGETRAEMLGVPQVKDSSEVFVEVGVLEREGKLVRDLEVLNVEECEKFTKIAVDRLAGYVKANGLRSLVMGISGGVDSAVVAAVALRAVEKLRQEGYEVGYKFVFLDADSDIDDLVKAKALADKFGFVLEYMDLTDHCNSSPLMATTAPDHPDYRVARGNVRCRARMIALRHFAKLTGGIYVDTDDLSEELMGFWTIYGDEGDVAVAQQVTKTEMYDLASFYGVPEVILDALPGDGLKVTEGNVASDQLGLPYLEIEYVMTRFIGRGFDHKGSWDQLDESRWGRLVVEVASTIGESEESVRGVLEQALRTAWKRLRSNPVMGLCPEREEFGFPELGTPEFNARCLKAIQARAGRE